MDTLESLGIYVYMWVRCDHLQKREQMSDIVSISLGIFWIIAYLTFFSSDLLCPSSVSVTFGLWNACFQSFFCQGDLLISNLRAELVLISGFGCAHSWLWAVANPRAQRWCVSKKLKNPQDVQMGLSRTCGIPVYPQGYNLNKHDKPLISVCENMSSQTQI